MKAGERQIEGRSEWQTADGRRLVINASLRRVVGGEGNDLVLICGQDQTEVIRQREELMAQRDFLAVVARATPSLLIAVERDGTVTVEGVNYAFRELTGYTDEEAIGAKFWDLVAPPELVDEVQAGVRGAGRDRRERRARDRVDRHSRATGGSSRGGCGRSAPSAASSSSAVRT